MEKKSRVHDDLLVGNPANIVTEEEKRPNHPDYATAVELKAMGFSGIRYNTLVSEVEIWVEGRMAKSLPAPNMQPEPEQLAKAYREVFGIDLSMMESLR